MSGKWVLAILTMAAIGSLFRLATIMTGTHKIKSHQSGVEVLQQESDFFQKATPGRSLYFPKDHGPHLNFETEWWYLTGLLKVEPPQPQLGSSSHDQKRVFGFQYTLFRRALPRGASENHPTSSWRSSQLLMVHATLADIENKKFYHTERIERISPLGLAGLDLNPFHFWINDWSLRGGTDFFPLTLQFQSQTHNDSFAYELEFTPSTGFLLHGDKGYSAKSASGENASYYYSAPRLSTEGVVRTQDSEYKVAGITWLDREWSTSALERHQIGWDWFGLRLSDGTDLMIFHIRGQSGESSFQNGTLRTSDGATHSLTKKDIKLEPQMNWKSPQTGVSYPLSWKIELPQHGLLLNTEPLMKNQELSGIFRYWEGAVQIRGQHLGNSVTGDGYMELTGYK